MTGNEKFRLKVVDDLRKNRVIVESDEDYITLLKKANKDLGDMVRLRDEQIATLTAERDSLKKLYESSEESVLALKETRNRLAEERDALKLTLDTFQQAAEHVIENGNTRRAFSTSEGWSMVHKSRLLDLEIIEERCDVLKKQRDALVEAATMAVEMIEYEKHERRHVRWKLQEAIASVKEK